MLPEDQGGVVDSRLRVYGVAGLRVVDASIFPIIPDGHPQVSDFEVVWHKSLLILDPGCGVHGRGEGGGSDKRGLELVKEEGEIALRR